LLTALRNATNVYFNYTGQSNCTNYEDTEATGTLAASGWNVLACNQLAMPASNGPDSMFPPSQFNYTETTIECQGNYTLTPQYQWALSYFGGYNIQTDFKAYSNIVFSNGQLDPWRAGSPNEYINWGLPVYEIKGGAHHLDLRLPNDGDNSTTVEWVREQEKSMIFNWVVAYQTNHRYYVPEPTIMQ
jgi:lysosomal Pro-X carboxypeptidase